MTKYQSTKLFLTGCLFLLCLAELETWLSIECLDAGGRIRTGFFVDRCVEAP